MADEGPEFEFNPIFHVKVNASTSLGFLVEVNAEVSVNEDPLPTAAHAVKQLIIAMVGAGFVGVSAASSPQKAIDASKSPSRPGVEDSSWDKEDFEPVPKVRYTDPLLKMQVKRSQNNDEQIEYHLFTRLRKGGPKQFAEVKGRGERDEAMISEALGEDVTQLKVNSVIEFKEGSTFTWELGDVNEKTGKHYRNLRAIHIED